MQTPSDRLAGGWLAGWLAAYASQINHLLVAGNITNKTTSVAANWPAKNELCA